MRKPPVKTGNDGEVRILQNGPPATWKKPIRQGCAFTGHSLLCRKDPQEVTNHAAQRHTLAESITACGRCEPGIRHDGFECRRLGYKTRTRWMLIVCFRMPFLIVVKKLRHNLKQSWVD